MENRIKKIKPKVLFKFYTDIKNKSKTWNLCKIGKENILKNSLFKYSNLRKCKLNIWIM